jgi:hypothetical protein
MFTTWKSEGLACQRARTDFAKRSGDIPARVLIPEGALLRDIGK